MARFSKTAGHVKLEKNDRVMVFGIQAKVDDLLLQTNGGAPNVLVFATIKNAELPNIFNLRDIEAVRMGSEWVNLKGESVAA